MNTVRTAKELRKIIKSYRNEGHTIGFAPTMGALHDGHLSLMDIAKEQADKTVVSIFVNPAQFAPHEDFDKYPRQEEADLEKLEKQGVDLVYLPEKEEIYPKDFSIKISVGDIGRELEGISRPHFFDGVALVVTKLLMQVQPDIAVFGEKDFQQLSIIKRLVKGLDIPVEIIGAPVIREENGLAMSSRNVYLSIEDKKIAANLFRIISNVADKIKNGDDVNKSIQHGKNQLSKCGFSKVDYIELRDSDTLARRIENSARLLAAVYFGEIRLIDNVEV